MTENVKFISEKSYNLLLDKLKEFQDETGIVILGFTFQIPFYPNTGLPMKITIAGEILE